MPFTVEDRHLIKVLREEKQYRYSARRFLSEFPNKNWSRHGLDHLLAKIDRFGTIRRRPGTGLTNRTVRTNDNIDQVADYLVQSQEDRPQTHRSIRQIARETSISRSSVHRIIKTGLKLKCLKKVRAQELTESNRFNRLQRSRELLKRYPVHLVDFIWFSDEKLLTIVVHNCCTFHSTE